MQNLSLKKGIVPIIVVILVLAISSGVVYFIFRNVYKAGAAAPLVATGMDTDKDGFADNIEVAIGTDSGKSCGINAWPADVNNDGNVNTIDLLIISRVSARKGDSNYDKRFDLNADGVVDSKDVTISSKYANKKCNETNLPISDEQYNCEKADVNKDGLVTQDDLYAVAGANNSTNAQYDINGDGIVNVLDMYLIAGDEYGRTCRAAVDSSISALVNGDCTKADVNKDSVVNILDLQQVAQNYGAHGGQYDTNGDGIVNGLDIHYVANKYQQTCKDQAAKAAVQALAQAAVTSEPDKPTCNRGDLNRDGHIDIVDLQIANSKYGQKTNLNDANGDGVINVIDLANIMRSYGKNCNQVTGAPQSITSPVTNNTTPTSSSTPVAKVGCGLKGDVNNDGAVNVIDYQIVSASITNKDTKGDVNGDGQVNVIDLQQLTANNGKTC